MSFKVVVNNIADEMQQAVLSMDQPVRSATTAAVVVAGRNSLSLGYANISAKLHGVKLAKSWSARYFPGNVKGKPAKESIDAAVWLYSRIPFLEVFEDGATIKGKPFLWIPLRNAPRNVGKGHATPKKIRALGIKLFSINKPGKPPLLAAPLNVTRAQAKRGITFSVSLSQLRKSANKDLRSRLGEHSARAGTVRMTVPLFFGVKSVTIKKTLDLTGITNRERDSLPSYYAANLKV